VLENLNIDQDILETIDLFGQAKIFGKQLGNSIFATDYEDLVNKQNDPLTLLNDKT